MAGVDLPGFPRRPRHEYQITLGEIDYTVRLTYRTRTRSWYLDLYDVDGVAIATGRRLSPGSSPLAPLEIDGLLFVFGIDPYIREDLATELLLATYYTDDELLPADTTTDVVFVAQ